MKRILKKNNLFIISNIIIFSLIVFFQAYFYKDITYWCEDIGFGFYKENQSIFYPLFAVNDYGGGYIQYFLTKFFTMGFPILFNMHPLDYASNPRGIILGIICALYVFSIAFYIRPINKSKTLFTLILLASAGFLYTNYYGIYARIVDINNYVFFRYIFSLFIYTLFWYYVYKNYLKKKSDINLKKITLMTILAFLLSSGLELLMFMSFINTACFLIYFFFFDRKSFLNNKFCTITSIIFVILACLWLNSPFYKLGYATKIPNEPDINLYYIIKFLKVFNELYMPFIWMYILILTFYLISKLKFKTLKTEKKALICSLIFELSTIIGILSLIFAGENYAGYFYLHHSSILFTFKMLTAVPIIILSGCIVKQIRNYKYRKIYNIIITSIFLLVSVFYIKIAIPNTIKNSFLVQLKTTKEITYINEKILRFYYLKEKTPVVLNYNGIEIGILGNSVAAYKEGECVKNNITNYYLPLIYKSSISKELGYCVSSDAIYKFYELGGSFTKEELQHIKFSRLKDNKFVLNQNKADIYSSAELNNKILKSTKKRAF